jgi:3-oxoacyl-[acyl-carrier protein] reductase
MSLKGKTALVTGSGRNIGRAVALHLADAGCNVVLNGSRDRAACEEVAEKIRAAGAEATIEMGDIGDREAVLAMAKSAIGRFGGVDVLINNAAIRPGGDFLEMSEADWDRVMDVNFTAAFHLIRAFLPGMLDRGWGRIVNFTGMNAQLGGHSRPAVTVSKHAMWGLTKSLSRDYGPQGVTCNIVSPGTIPDASVDTSEQHLEALRKANPAGRLGTADDIAATVDLLVSEQGGFINGQMLQVNGGVVNQF